MELDLDKMERIGKEIEAGHRTIENATNQINTAIDLFDMIAKDCNHYISATCHGENDPECDHNDADMKWCDAEYCPLLVNKRRQHEITERTCA